MPYINPISDHSSQSFSGTVPETTSIDNERSIDLALCMIRMLLLKVDVHRLTLGVLKLPQSLSSKVSVQNAGDGDSADPLGRIAVIG